MHGDGDGAARVARIAAGFEWTWTYADLAPFCVKAGWHVTETHTLETTLTTDLSVDHPRARAGTSLGLRRWRRGRSVMSGMSLYVTDFSAEPDADSQVDAAVTMLIDRLATEIGTPRFPDDHYSATAAIWDLPKVVLQLVKTAPDKRVPVGRNRAISMYLSCPAAKARADALYLELDRRFLEQLSEDELGDDLTDPSTPQ